jgi:hypothetical protein
VETIIYNSIMERDKIKCQAIFKFGIIFFNSNKLYDALTIFEFLSDLFPDLRIYKEYETRIRNSLSEEFGQVVGKERLHLRSATPYSKTVRIADLIASFEDPNLIDVLFDWSSDSRPDHLLAKANASVKRDVDRWTQFTNEYLKFFGLSPISINSAIDTGDRSLFFKLVAAKLTKVSGPLLTICMTCFNSSKYIEVAVESILNQTYENFELYIVDDFSQDNSLEIIRQLAARDPRIRVIENAVGKGTYASRNHVLSLAQGEFFAVHDSDDFALPERFAIQVNWLLNHPASVALLAEWIRISIDGRFEYKTGWEGSYQHQAHATLVLRTTEIKKRLGYWDSVFFGADTEMIFRMRKVYGDHRVGMLKIPMTFALSHAESLTQHPVIGINKGINKRSSDVRVEYRKSWEAWHGRFSDDSDGYIEFPQVNRPFTVPSVMLGGIRDSNL